MEQSVSYDYENGSNLSESGNVLFHDDLSGYEDVSRIQEHFTTDSLLELCNSFWKRSPGAKYHIQPYLRGCKWSPDGTCCLSVVNHDGFHIMELPRDLYDGCPTRDRMITLLPAVVHVKESGLVYDFCWYPKMNSQYPETCSWISTKINSPIQMWDAYDGSLRCSYRGYNAVDEMEPALSCIFIDSGQRIVGGYKKCLKTFNVERPGREFLEHKIKTPASCMATSGKLLAVGSWNTNIKLFSIPDGGTYKSIGNLYAHKGGITHLQFTPDGTKLVSGARKDDNLCVWDVRCHRRPLNILKRCVSTNQRIYFDISSCGRYLVSGGTDGVIRVWDNMLTKWTDQFNVQHADQENATFRFRLHRDCCNSVSIHPSRPILATGSGQFHILDPVKTLEDECENDISNEETSDELLLDNNNVNIIETQVTNFLDADKMHLQDVSKNSSNNVVGLGASEQLNFGIKGQNIAKELPSDNIVSESCCESPSAKKPKWDYEINAITHKELNDNGAPDNGDPGNITNIDYNNILKQVNIEKDHNNIKHTLDPNNLEDDDLDNESKINIFNKQISQAEENFLSTPVKAFNVVNKNEVPCIIKPLSNQSNQCNPYESNVICDNGTQSSNVSNHDEGQTVSNGNHTKETDDNSKLGSSPSETNELGNRSSELLNINILSPSKLTKLSAINVMSSKMSTECCLKEFTSTKYSLDNSRESEDDCKNIDENKMKYSSYAENNLTFWWISKSFVR